MLHVVFTLDYEIHGNGEGCPLALMVEPTRRMLDQFDRHGARLTILADVAEILKFREYASTYGRDDYHSAAISNQLREAVQRGHDVQLHLHSSWFNAQYQNQRWLQDWSEYDFASLPVERIRTYLRTGKEFLETLLRPVSPTYRCNSFRAANWSMHPSRNAMVALSETGFRADTSVFKGGARTGLVNFDYSHAPHAMLPWRASLDDVCREDPASPIWEFPIYSEQRWLGAFLSPNRLYRAVLGRLHPLPSGEAGPTHRGTSGLAKWNLAIGKQAWKADFNQCTGKQLIRALDRASCSIRAGGSKVAPFVLIGHSKLFTRANARSLEPFLVHAASSDSFGFSTLSDAVGATADSDGVPSHDRSLGKGNPR